MHNQKFIYASEFTSSKFKKYLGYKISIEDNWELIYKVIILIFDKKIDESYLDKLDIKEIYYIYYFIENYIKEIVINRFKALGVENVEVEESVFDEYDKEEGYIKEKEQSIYENLLEIFNNTIRFSIKQCKNSLKESMDMDICVLLDYIKYEMDYLEEHKEDEKDYLD